MDIKRKVEYDETGQLFTLKVHLDYNSKNVLEFPDSCLYCPVGYMASDEFCGRNIPLTDEDFCHRPATCKLQKVSLLDLLSEDFERRN